MTVVMTMFARSHSIHQARVALVNRLMLTQTISSQQLATHDFLQPLQIIASGACQSIGTQAQELITSTSSWWWPTCLQMTQKFMPRRTCLWSKVAPIWRLRVMQLTIGVMNAAKYFVHKNNSFVSYWQLPQPLAGHRAQDHLVFLKAVANRFNWMPNHRL